MKHQEPEQPAGDAREKAAVEQESGPTCADLVLLCHPRHVENLVRAFEAQIAHAEGALPLFVVWSGVSRVLHQGVIVLEAEGSLPPSFLHGLTIDQEIFDVVLYEWTRGDGEQIPGETTSNNA